MQILGTAMPMGHQTFSLEIKKPPNTMTMVIPNPAGAKISIEEGRGQHQGKVLVQGRNPYRWPLPILVVAVPVPPQVAVSAATCPA